MKTIELNYKVFGEFGEDLIILHGLLGSLDNWQTIARKLSETYRVWIVDQRNHGLSPHTEDMNYELMAQDIEEFMNRHGIQNTHIAGHSMGGKAAMTFALNYPDRMNHLIVIDIGPKPYQGDHLPYIRAMQETNATSFQSRNEVEEIIKTKVSSPWVVQVIMKNLGRNKDKNLFWKPNLNLLSRVYQDIMGSDLPEKLFTGKVDFIKGSESDYIQESEFDSYKKYFPNAQLHIVQNAGHMVHTEQPEDFYNLLLKLLGE